MWKPAWVALCSLAAAPLFALDVGDEATRKETPVFDRGEKDDFEKGAVYKDKDKDKKKSAESKRAKDTRTAKAVAYWVKQLRDPDVETRRSAAEMLGVLASPTSVPELIAVLDPQRNEKIAVMLTAHASLVRITGKNFGHKNYDAWVGWWSQNKEEFIKKAETGPDEISKTRADYSNTVGMELMKNGQFESAYQQFVSAVDSDPTSVDYRNNMGLSLMNMGRYLDAIVTFEEVAALRPDLAQPVMNIGHCYDKMGKVIEAEAQYKKAMEIDKDGRLWEPVWLLGANYKKRGEWSMAYEYLDQARMKAEKLRISSDMRAKIANDLAIVHYGLDQYNSAWKEIKNVETLGYEANPDFVKKVRKALKDQGIDPDADDKKAREILRGGNPESASNAPAE